MGAIQKHVLSLFDVIWNDFGSVYQILTENMK